LFLEAKTMRGRTEQLRSQLGEDLEPLLTGCGHDDPRAWDRLLEAARQMAVDLGRGTYKMGLEDAEDLAQLVEIRIMERLPQLRCHEAFPLWARRIVHHVALDMLRQRRPLLSLDALSSSEGIDHSECQHEEIAAAPEATDPYDLTLLRIDLERALSRLPALYREPIQLHLLQGMPQEEVGRRLGRPRSTVATQIGRGLHRLRRALVTFESVSV
jgi:RNA polymerase sigma factor (sigma-70 family)